MRWMSGSSRPCLTPEASGWSFFARQVLKTNAAEEACAADQLQRRGVAKKGHARAGGLADRETPAARAVPLRLILSDASYRIRNRPHRRGDNATGSTGSAR